MGRVPCCDKANVKRGPWSLEEDAILRDYLQKHGNGGNWISLPLKAGLRRCGKSCRLRWLNYLRPNIKHGGFTEEEDNIICHLYTSLGSKWSKIASHLSGRTDNDVKNHWNTKLKKKLMALRVTTNIPKREHPNSASFQVSIPDFLPQLNNNMGFYDQYCPLPGLFVEVPPASGGFSEQAESSTRADLFPTISRDAAATGGSDINELGSWSSVGGAVLDGDLGGGSTSSPDFGFDPEVYELLYGLGFYDNSIELDDFNKTLF